MTLPLEERVAETIARLDLVAPSQPIFVALSGGTDSVALLRVLHCLGYRLEALHCNFALRGANSDDDEHFVRHLCASLSVPLRVQHFDTNGYATREGLSIEMAARALRYDWFRQILEEHPEAVVAVAHNADDQIETLLLNLSMGTGIRGLSGMPYKRKDRIIRPLMDCPRHEIETYLASIAQAHRLDESNDDLVYRRNYIRHRLLPAFEELNPAFRSSAVRTIEHLRGAEALYLYAVDRLRHDVMPSDNTIDISALLQTPHPQTLLYEILRPMGFTSKQCYAIALALPNLPTGAQFVSHTHRVARAWDVLEIRQIEQAESDFALNISSSTSGAVDLPLGRLEWQTGEVEALLDLSCPNSEALFDADALLALPCWQVRRKRIGDSLAPYGMRGRKKLKRIFVEKRLTPRERSEALLLCVADEPIWLIGHLADRRYAIGEQSKRYIRFSLHPRS